MNKEVEEYLIKNQDLKYRDFSKNLSIGSKKEFLGVRIPILRNYAKVLSKKHSLDYLMNNILDNYYEEILLKGFIIGNYKNLEYPELINYIDNHLTKITDWSLCDTFVASLKITKKYSQEIWDYLLKKIKSKKEFEVRFGLVMILNYYINDEYKSMIYDVIKNVQLDNYYVKMANAWLISYMFIHYFEETYQFILNSKIDIWVKKKGITKTIESREISLDQKNKLRKLREEIK